MLRGAKEERVQRQDGKVFEVRDLKISEEYRNPNYQLLEHNPAVLTRTGHLKIFELLPLRTSEPTFEARWDGGSRDPGNHEKQDLDIDIRGVSLLAKRRFRKGIHGYSGHHSIRDTSAEGRVYKLEICIPGKAVFRGTVSFTVHRRLERSTAIRPVATLGMAKPLRAPAERFVRIRALLSNLNDRNLAGGKHT